MKKKKIQKQLNAPATKADVEDVGAHIVGAISKVLEEYATKEDLKSLATKEDLNKVEKKLEGKIDDVASDVSEIRRRVIDLERDTITRREFDDFKGKVL